MAEHSWQNIFVQFWQQVNKTGYNASPDKSLDAQLPKKYWAYPGNLRLDVLACEPIHIHNLVLGRPQ